jgi:hypothetical protein
VSLTYALIVPASVLILSVLYNFLWKVIHEYTHLGTLKLIVGKELYSYKVRLTPHYLGTDWVSASVTWNARKLTKKEHGIIAFAPHILEIIACAAFMCSGLFLLGDFLRDNFYIFFLWATFWFGGCLDLLAAATADSKQSDLIVYSDCYELDQFEVRYLCGACALLSMIAGFLIIFVVL